MNFELSNEQKDIQKAAMEFAQGEFDPDLALELDENQKFPEAIWKKASQLGFIGVHYPEEFGGQGLGLFENILIIEAFCRVDSGIGCALSSVDDGSEIILKFGSYEQKKNLLSLLAGGKIRLSVAFAESEDEKDFTSISTIIENEGKEYIIRGRKQFVYNALLSEYFIILGKNPEGEWITLLMDREKEGLEIIPIEKMGLRMISFGNLNLDGIRVPLKAQLGNNGDGLVYVEHHHFVKGIKSAAQGLGIAQGALDRALEYAKQREQFGRRLIDFQVIRHKLAEMAVNIEICRMLVFRCALEYDQDNVDENFISLTQLEMGRRMVQIVDEGLQIFGGYGYMAEQSIEHYFRDAWAISVMLGAEEELKDSISKRLLGVQK